MYRCLAALVILAAAAPLAASQPKLVVLMVFDQLRGDYPMRWRELYTKEGFRRLMEQGVHFSNCHYDYCYTVTAAGHASLVTGCGPDKHGIMANEWYDRDSGREIASIESDRYLLVPRVPVKKGKMEKGAWPGRRLQPSVGDVLHEMSKGKAKIVSLSLKDRAAILLANLLALACYWFDSGSGAFVTSTYYRDAPHAWVADFNKSKFADQWFGKDWTRLRDDIDYVKHSGPDDVLAESSGYKQGRVFPHPMDGGLTKPGEAFYDAVTTSPHGNTLLMALAKRAIEAEQLGQDDVPDLLCVSFSSNDLVGHNWGPESQEVLDMTLRTDLLIQEFLAYLDAKIGAGNYAIVLSADHGIAPIPQLMGGGRIVPKKLEAAANAWLNARFATPKADLPWIESLSGSCFYLNQRLIADKKLVPATVEKALAEWVATQDGVEGVYTRFQFDSGDKAAPEIVRRSYFPHRCGEVFLTPRRHWQFSTRETGTTHGSPYDYDTHVPLIVYGAGVPTSVQPQRIAPTAAAAILAHLLRIDPPAGAEASLPEVFKKR